MKSGLIVVVVLVVIALIFGFQLMGTRNELVQEREAITGAWSQVDVVLQRRADLIPNLVATVQGYAAQERDVLIGVTNARAKATSVNVSAEAISDPAAMQKFQQAQAELSGALGRLLVVAENYPQLKSDQNFIRLQDELANTENKIAQERRKYNQTVQKYNTDIELFPKNIAASMFGFQRNDAYFKAEGAAKTPPKVKF